MSIQEDYLKASEGGLHLAREKLRHDVIMKRLDVCLSSVSQVDALQPVCAELLGLHDQFTKIGKFQ